jgi:tetratricopeptide (TPR) repeat protein
MAKHRNKPVRNTSHLAQASKLFDESDFAGAIRVAEEGLVSRKNDPALLGIMGVSQLMSGNFEAAIETLQRVSLATPGGNFARVNLAGAYILAGRLEEAHRALDDVLKNEPENMYALSKKGAMLVVENKLAEAESLLAAVVEGQDHVYPGIATTWGLIMISTDEPERAIEVVRAAIEDIQDGDQSKVGPMFVLAKLLEKSKCYNEAFEAYTHANKLKYMPHSAPSRSRDIQSMLGAWSQQRVDGLPRVQVASEQPVFIVGMPRSGTSLVEQILAALDGLAGAGELDSVPQAVRGVMSPLGIGTTDLLTAPQILTQGVVESLSHKVLEEMRGAAPASADASRITDKNPLNVFHLGLIAAMFPGARVIHCVRDPIDTCLSCYFQNFGSALSFAYDLQNIGLYYNDYRRTIAHWKNVLDLQIYDVVYEELVADPEPNMRALVDFVGLEWDERCLEFHKTDRVTVTASNDQVRRPMYQSSVKKWERYASRLAPLLHALEIDE